MLNYEGVVTAMGELDEDTLISFLNDVMADGGSEAPKAMEACQAGMNKVGSLFESGEYFVGDLIFAGELMSQAVEIMQTALISGGGGKIGRMIMCTVEGDLHDIGKNIVISMLEAGGFEVLDLGIDVSPSVVLETAQRENIKIIALSGVLTLAIESMQKTIELFKSSGMDSKIIIGGNPTNEGVCNSIGADSWSINPQETVEICKKWAEELK